MRINHAVASLATLIFLDSTFATADEPAVELRDGDRITFIGGTFIERMQQNGYLETLLTVAHPNKNLTFRNLGWSGDNVHGESRALFGRRQDGFKRLIGDTKLTKPTLIVLAYGGNEAFAGDAGLEDFRSGLKHLLAELDKATDARFLLLGPLKQENLGPPLPDPSTYNADLAKYVSVLKEVASEGGHGWLDLNEIVRFDNNIVAPHDAWTTNGRHLKPEGYRRLAKELLLEFSGAQEATTERGHLETLRNKIIEKNELFFHRYRPQNETYLFLFRKHEQGNNAVEIPQFDPLVEEKEKEIAELQRTLGE